MSEPYRYSKHGVYIFENFENQLERNNFEDFQIHVTHGHGWFLSIAKDVDDETLYPFFYSRSRNPYMKHKIRGYLNVVNMDPSIENFKAERILDVSTDRIWYGNSMPISEVLDPENGWLDENGALTVVYGIQVEAILSNDHIWKFNIVDKFFDYEERRNMMDFEISESETMHCHVKLFSFHSSNYDSSEQLTPHENNILLWNSSRTSFYVFFQMLHDVRIKPSHINPFAIVIRAHHYKTRNVIRLCEHYLIQDPKYMVHLGKTFEKMMTCVKFAIKYDMRHFLNHLLKTEHCSNRLEFSKWILENLQLESLSSGVMKMLAKKIFES